MMTILTQNQEKVNSIHDVRHGVVSKIAVLIALQVTNT